MSLATCHLPLVDLVPLSGDIDHLIERCMGRPMTADEDSMMSRVICHVPFVMCRFTYLALAAGDTCHSSS